MKKTQKKIGWIPAALIALSVVPMVGGVVRLVSLGAPATPDSARFVAAPTPVVVHIVAAAVYCLVGAFQFSTGFRLRFPRWHRSAGKGLVVSGLLAGLSGLWMTAFYDVPTPMQGLSLRVTRFVVGAAMVTAIAVGYVRILQRDVASHEAWMIRAYALGQGAGTQAVLMLPLIVAYGELLGAPRDALMILAWVINAALAEWIVTQRRRRAGLGARRARPAPVLA